MSDGISECFEKIVAQFRKDVWIYTAVRRLPASWRDVASVASHSVNKAKPPPIRQNTFEDINKGE